MPSSPNARARTHRGSWPSSGVRAADPRAERDALIAATAIVHGMTVVTGNRADFEAAGVALNDPRTET